MTYNHYNICHLIILVIKTLIKLLNNEKEKFDKWSLESEVAEDR